MSVTERAPRPGELVVRRSASCAWALLPGSLGLYIGRRVFEHSDAPDGGYVCSEVWWFDQPAPNGDIVSTIQTDLLALHPAYETLNPLPPKEEDDERPQ